MLIPKAKVFARATELNLSPSEDRLDRFRKAQLLDDLVLIPGTTQRGFLPEQANRFLFLLWLGRALGQRLRPSAMAFWLCWYGVDGVPPELVCEHIDRTLVSFLAMMGREFDRRRVPVKGVRNPEQWQKVEKPWGKFVLKHYFGRAINSPIARQVFSRTAGLALRALIAPTSFDAVAPIVRRLGHLIGVDASKTEAFREIWAALREGVQLFTLDQHKNPLVTEIRKINATDPALIIPIVRDTRLMVAAMGAAFPIYRMDAAPEAADPNDKKLVYIAKHFAPGMVAATALTRDFPHAIEMRENLRKGNYEPVVAEFHQIKIVTDNIAARIGIGPKQ